MAPGHMRTAKTQFSLSIQEVLIRATGLMYLFIYLFIYFSLSIVVRRPVKGLLVNRADPENAASDQGLHGLQIV